jgi:hypothetical protein
MTFRCSAFSYSGNNCSMFLLEKEKISDLTFETSEDKKVFYNLDAKTSKEKLYGYPNSRLQLKVDSNQPTFKN